MSSGAKLIAAIQAGDVAAVKRILELQPASVHGRHPLGQHTPLHAAAAVGSLHVVRELLSVGGPSAAQALDEGGATPLHVACQQGHLAVVKELLADAGRRSCMKAVNRDGATPLHLAAAAGHPACVAALVNAGARTDARDRAGRTPLDVVDVAAWPDVAEVLAQRRTLTPAGAGRSRSRTAGAAPPGAASSSARSSQASPSALHHAAAKLSSEVQGPQLLILPDRDQQQHQDQQGVGAADGKGQSQRRQRQQRQQPTSGVAAGVGYPPGYREPQQAMPTLQQPGTRPGSACVVPGAAGAIMAAAGFGGVAQAHWQQYAAPPEPLGPLRSAQAAGPGAAGAAAAAAANGLARTFVHQAQPSHGGSMRQWSGPGDEPGRVHAPPDTGCLPTGRLQQQDASAAGMRDASASAAGTCTPRHMQLPPTPQGSPLAALAAAVSATGRMGPLQQPLQLQLGDLASKVHQLEAWFESQAELIPAWREVLSAVQGVERSMEEQQVKQEEHRDQAARNEAALQAMAAQLAALDEAGVLVAIMQQKEQAALWATEHQTLKVCVAEYAEQVKQLQAQLAAMHASSAASQRAADEGQMQTVWQRLHSLEASLRELQQQGVPAMADSSDDSQLAVNSSAAAGTAEADARLLALEASVAELRHLLLEQQAASCPMPTTPGGTSVSSRVAAFEAASCDKATRSSALRSSTTADQLRELRQQVAAVSASVSGLARAAPLQSGGLDEAVLPFMETTGACLARHEQQLEEMQAILPQLDMLTAQQPAMRSLQEQLATLQTAFDLATGMRHSGGGAKDARLLLGGGPLGSHKAAAEVSKSAASMVQLQSQMGKLQSQMSTLSAAVEELHLEWGSASASMSAECDAIRSAWEAEASRMSAAEVEAARDLAEQRQELLAREDRLVQLREAAMAEEDARQRQAEQAACLTKALQGLQDGHQQLHEWLGNLEASSADVQLQLAALQGALHEVAAAATQAASMPQPPECSPQADAPAVHEGGAAEQAAGSDDGVAPAADTGEDASNPFLEQELSPNHDTTAAAAAVAAPAPAAAAVDAGIASEADAAPQQHGYQPGAYWMQPADGASEGAVQAAVVAAADVVCHVGAHAPAPATDAGSTSWLGRALSSRKGSKATAGTAAQPAGDGGPTGVAKLFSGRHSKASQQEQEQGLFGDELLLHRKMSGGGGEAGDDAQPTVLAGSGRWRKKKPWQRLVRDAAPV